MSILKEDRVKYRFFTALGAPKCSHCGSFYMAPVEPLIHEGKWLVVYCLCREGKDQWKPAEVSLGFWQRKGWYPAMGPTCEDHELYCWSCGAVRTAVQVDKGQVHKCAECGEPYLDTQERGFHSLRPLVPSFTYGSKSP